nr:hypothetical protein B14D6.390 [imported] - Neurospora crassa [Neurospora crassa]
MAMSASQTAKRPSHLTSVCPFIWVWTCDSVSEPSSFSRPCCCPARKCQNPRWICRHGDAYRDLSLWKIQGLMLPRPRIKCEMCVSLHIISSPCFFYFPFFFRLASPREHCSW